MTLIGQHARSGDNVPENSREGVKNGNVDKIRRRQKKQKVHFFLDFQKTKIMEPSEIEFLRAPCFSFFENLKKMHFFVFLMPETQEISTV